MPSYSWGRPWQGGEGTWAQKYSPCCNCCQADSSSQSRIFPRFLHLPVSAGAEMPAWPPAAGRLSGGGEVEGAAGLSWSFSDPDIKHDAVLAMHFVLLFSEPRIYKPTGRRTSSSSRALPVLLLAAGISLLHAPELQKGLCCHSFSWLIKGKEKSSRSLLFGFLFRN